MGAGGGNHVVQGARVPVVHDPPRADELRGVRLRRGRCAAESERARRDEVALEIARARFNQRCRWLGPTGDNAYVFLGYGRHPDCVWISGDEDPFDGDTPWSLTAQLTKAEAEQYLENRRLKGFNTIIVNLIGHKFCDNPPKNRDGRAGGRREPRHGLPSIRGHRDTFDHRRHVAAERTGRRALVQSREGRLPTVAGSPFANMGEFLVPDHHRKRRGDQLFQHRTLR